MGKGWQRTFYVRQRFILAFVDSFIHILLLRVDPKAREEFILIRIKIYDTLDRMIALNGTLPTFESYQILICTRVSVARR
jgi:hypothetical protein